MKYLVYWLPIFVDCGDSNRCMPIIVDLSRLTVVSRGAKKKQAVRDERVSYLQVAPL